MTRAEKVIAFIENYCRIPEGTHVGQPIKLEEFQKKFIYDVYDNPHDTEKAILSIGRKNGKALALDTPIPTPEGWRTMGDLQVGDKVFDENGNPCNVTFVTEAQYNRKCYWVEFADGARILADADHQWTVKSRAKHGKVMTLTTEQMRDKVLIPWGRKCRVERNFSVPVAGAVKYCRKFLPIAPYTLGAWLGDGKSRGARIYSNDPEVIENIKLDGYPVRKLDERFAYTISDGVKNRMKDCIQSRLRALNLLRNKHIPLIYLTSSIPQRWALLQGLMDTDGYISKAGQCEFVSITKRLALDVLELVRSLGHKATLKIDEARLKGRYINQRYRVQFWGDKNTPCVRLKRKVERLKSRATTSRNNTNYIVSIKPTQSVPVKCIQVDSPNSLYLAGKAFTPTHNTALIACLLLTHLVGTEARQNSQIVSGAMSREQASLVFNLACKMINLNPDLQKIIHIIPSGKRLHGLPMNTEYKALAAEGKTAQGLSPVLAILDEVGQVKGAQNDFVDAITTAQGAHENPLLIAISTQASEDSDLLSIWIDDAKASEDPHIVCHVYAAPQDADVLDREGWKAANPALGVFRSLRDIEKLATQASRMPSAENTFRNLNLNQRVSTNNPFISVETWKTCADAPCSLQGLEVYAGLDLSARTDLTAFVLVGRDAQGVAHVQPFFWTPKQGLADRAKRDRAPYDVWARQGYLRTTEGATVDYAFVVKEIAEIIADLDVRAVAFDRWRIDVFKQELDRAGLAIPMVAHGQGFKDMSPAIDALEADLLNGRLRHGAHPVLNMCALNATVVKDPAGNRKLEKQKSTGRIDGIVALSMAMGVMCKNKEQFLDKNKLNDYFNNIVVF